MRFRLILLIALLAAPPLRADWGGPDGFGYRWIDSQEPSGPAYQWTEIRELGTALDAGDDQSPAVALPRLFRYYGVFYDSVYVCSNGFLSFASPDANPYPEPLPAVSLPNAMAAPLWNDLNPADPQSGGIYFYHDASGDRFIVEWDSVIHFGSQHYYSFQAVLGLSDFSLALYYRSAWPGWQEDAASTGIEDHSGTVGLGIPGGNLANQYAVRFAAPPDTHDVRAVRITSPAWYVEPDSLAVPELLVRNAGLAWETFAAICRIARNDTVIFADTSFVTLLAPGDSAFVGFEPWTAGPSGQRYDLLMFCALGDDQNQLNDSAFSQAVSFPFRNKVSSQWRQGTVDVDGTLAPGEWPEQGSVDISDILAKNGETIPPGSARLYSQNDSVCLYLALDAVIDGALDTNDLLTAWIDDDGDGIWGGGDSEGRYQLTLGAIDSLLFFPMPSGTPLPAPGIQRASSAGGGHLQRELAIPLGTDAGWKLAQSPGGMCRALVWADDGHDGRRFGWWPQNADPSREADPECYGLIFLAQPPSGTAGGPDRRPIPPAARLGRSQPNPFQRSTTIDYQIPQSGRVSVKVYNIAGQTVRTLVDCRQPAGVYFVTWDGRNESDRRAAPGIFLCRLETGATRAVMRMVLVK